MIQCEKCGSDKTEQSDTRQRPNTLYVWRRRTCKSCGYKFTTREYRVRDLTKLNNEDCVLVADQIDEILEDLMND